MGLKAWINMHDINQLNPIKSTLNKFGLIQFFNH